MKENGFTLIELLIVMAIAVILLLLAIFGSRSGQDTTVLTTAVNDFVSEVTYVRNSAISGLNKVNGINLGCAKSGISGACVHNWIYGFYIEPSNIYAGVCNTTYCYRYSVVMAVKDLTPANGGSCQDQLPGSSYSTDNITSPSVPGQISNSMYGVNLYDCTYDYQYSSAFPGPYTYLESLPHGVYMTNPSCSSSSCEIPFIQEISGNIYVYKGNPSLGSVENVASIPDGAGQSVTFTFGYNNFRQSVTFYDLNSGSNANSFVIGPISTD